MSEPEVPEEEPEPEPIETGAFADYTFYTTEFLGNLISSTDFPRLALRASERVDEMTYGRASSIIDEDDDADRIRAIKMATCAVADAVSVAGAPGGGNVVAESVGDLSVTYSRPHGYETQTYQAAKVYLARWGLLYGGLT